MTPLIDIEQQAEFEHSIQNQFVGAVLAVATAIGFLLVMLAVLGAMVGVGHCDDGGRSATSEAVSGVQGSSPAVGQAPAQQPAAGSPAAEVTTGSQTVTPAPCSWSESQGVGSTLKPGADRTTELRIRAQGECLTHGVYVAARIDGWAAPGGASAPTFADLGTISAGEGWLRVRREFTSNISIFGLAGIQTALRDGQLGLGGANTTFGAGVHFAVGGAWADLGIVDRYSASGRGARVIAALSVPAFKGVTLTLNAAWGKGGWFMSPATMAGPGSGQ